MQRVNHDKHIINSKAAIRLRAIHRLRSIGTALTSYTKRMVNQFVDDDEVSIERFRLLVILAGFPVNVLFHQQADGQTVACETKADIQKRMYSTNGSVEFSMPSDLHKMRGGAGGATAATDATTSVKTVLSILQGIMPTTEAGTNAMAAMAASMLLNTDFFVSGGSFFSFAISAGLLYMKKDAIIEDENILKKLKFWEKKSEPDSLQGIYIFTLTTIVINFLFTPAWRRVISIGSSPKPAQLSLAEARRIPLRKGWELRENKFSKHESFYFYHPRSKQRNTNVPIDNDELPYNWVEWIDPKNVEKKLYKNIFTKEEIKSLDEMENELTHGELKLGWNDAKRNKWVPPPTSPYYKLPTYKERPIENQRLEDLYGVMTWEYWDKKRTKHEPGHLRYRFIKDGDAHFNTKHYSSEWEVIQAFHQRKRDTEAANIAAEEKKEADRKAAEMKEAARKAADMKEAAERHAAAEKKAAEQAKNKDVSKKSKSTDDHFFEDFSHLYKKIMTPLNVFGLRVMMATIATGAVATGSVKILSKFMDNRQFAKVLAAPKDAVPSVGKDIAVPKIHEYQNTLQRIDNDLHTLFVNCNNDVPSLFTSLLRLRKTREAFYHRRILPYHVIRTNGHVRTSANEMALAIAHHWQWGNLLGIITTRIRNLGAMAFSRRKPKSKRLTQRKASNQKNMTRRRTMAGGHLLRTLHTTRCKR